MSSVPLQAQRWIVFFAKSDKEYKTQKITGSIEITVGLAGFHVFFSKASDLWFAISDVGSNLKISSKMEADFENSGLNRIHSNTHQ